jgi:hypothetical protein
MVVGPGGQVIIPPGVRIGPAADEQGEPGGHGQYL